MPNNQTNLGIVCEELYLLFLTFHEHNRIPLGPYEPVSPYTKELHGETHRKRDNEIKYQKEREKGHIQEWRNKI